VFTVLLTSCLTGLDLSSQIKTKIVSCHTADSKPVNLEVIGTVILPPLVFCGIYYLFSSRVHHFTPLSIFGVAFVL
ncbi:MAG: hypothetical protein ACK56I_32550, partial [bacterium]